MEAEQIPLDLSDLAILVTNSNVKHQLTGSEYPQRRAQCQEAADRLGLPSLRGAKIEDLESKFNIVTLSNFESSLKSYYIFVFSFPFFSD